MKNKPLIPGFLLLELSKSGIHLLPRNEDAALGEIKLKDFYAEERAIIDVASAVRAFAFRSCKWNPEIEPENIVLKIRENLEFDKEFYEDYEPDWRYVSWWPNKCAFVKCCDDHDKPDMGLAHGHETHSILS